MRLGRAWRPLLAVFGATPARSFVEVGRESVRFRFGPGFDQTIPREEIEEATLAHWPAIGGIGWRLWIGAHGGVVGLIGSLRDVVEVSLEDPRKVRVLGIPFTTRRIYVSLEDPERFVEELRAPGRG
jgi:hypothetical protein